ncbi:MAG: outer membrane beta-barrel protein [Gemmatimonadaceae bacterium]|nr:outer membrane beta-barrel protein [Gemmatimonadaceae bacterium]
MHRLATLAIGVISLSLLSPATGYSQSIGYSIVPSAERIQWNAKMALEDEWMYGGRVALRFGKIVELQPFYFVGKKYGIDASRAAALFGPQSSGRTLDIEHYGITTQLNLGTGNVVPFLRGGGGILRFAPDSGRRQDRLAVTAGGGIRFGIGTLQAELFAEQLGFRLDPRRLFTGDSLTGGSSVRQNNFVYGGAISIPISVAPDEDEAVGLRGTTAPIEPFVGRLRYASSAGLSDQNVAGIRGGLDFSPLFGVRGFYWRGVNEARDKFVSVEGYGAEGQFNLNTGPGVSPYVVAGAGRINFSGSYRDSLGTADNDRDALILGAGATFQLSQRIRFNAALRDYVIARNDSLESATTTGDLTHNRMLTAGFTISIGGKSGASDRARAAEQNQRVTRARLASRDSTLRMLRDSVRVARDARELPASRRPRAGVMRDSMARGMRTDSAGRVDRWITIPVPVNGEVILRYGYPPTADSAKAPSTPVVHRDTVIVRRDTVVIDTVYRQSTVIRDVTVSPTMAPSTSAANAPRARNTPLTERFRQLSSRDLMPFVGVGGGDAGTQAVASLRLDLGTLASGLEFVPEFAVGVGGDGTSVLALANVQYRFGSFAGETALRPYVTGGAGIFSPSVLAVNTAVGASIDLRRGRSSTPWLGYVELQGLNLFNDTRLMFGIRIR